MTPKKEPPKTISHPQA
uniref:Uncharacterized protein n=1 Tax=Anguilla anguilla TaxID=7936 RepID=A0A0E9VH61_ANGAN